MISGKSILILVSCFIGGCFIVSCSTPPPAEGPFPDLPKGVGHSTLSTRPVPSQEQPLRLFSIGEGTGLMGFDSMSFYPSGKVYVVWGVDKPGGCYEATTMIPKQQIEPLLSAANSVFWKHTHDYQNDEMHDGTQGFVYVEQGDLIHLTWLSNNFPLEYHSAWKMARELVMSLPQTSWKKIHKADAHRLYKRYVSARKR